MSLGQRLKARREALGLSLEEVGEAIGVHRSTVLRYEKGDTKRIPLETVDKLADALKTTSAELLGVNDPDPDGLDPEIRVIARGMQKMPPDKREILFKIIRTMTDIADEELTRNDAP